MSEAVATRLIITDQAVLQLTDTEFAEIYAEINLREILHLIARQLTTAVNFEGGYVEISERNSENLRLHFENGASCSIRINDIIALIDEKLDTRFKSSKRATVIP